MPQNIFTTLTKNMLTHVQLIQSRVEHLISSDRVVYAKLDNTSNTTVSEQTYSFKLLPGQQLNLFYPNYPTAAYWHFYCPDGNARITDYVLTP